MRAKLKVGLLLDGANVPYWAAKAIDRIVSSEHAEIVLLVIDGGTERDPLQGLPRESFLHDMYNWLDRRNNQEGIDPLAPMDIPASLDKVGRVYIMRARGAARTVPEDALRRIKERDLDVLFDIGNVTPLGEVSKLSRYGIWSFSPGDGDTYDGRPPGFWEIYDGIPVTTSHVRRVNNGSSAVIYRSHSHTVMRSEKRNREQIFHKGISFVPRLLEQLYQEGEGAIKGGEPLYAWGPRARPGPGNLDMVAHLMRRTPGNLGFAAKRALFEERWAVRYKLGKGVPTSFDGFTTLVPPPGTWWGDPQAEAEDSDFYIFVEELELPRSRHHGHISVIKVDAEGNSEGPVTVLERPYHLSYPFVFQWKGRHYMVPESSANRTVELYEAVEFPYKWQHVRDLMTGVSAVDATIVRRDGLWWMFCNLRENEEAPINDELFIFRSDDLLAGHWEPHPLNPVISDARTARPAGRIFEQNGVLYRPSQDCSRCYGYAVNINKIAELDEKRYREVRTAYIEPKNFPGASRVHTFSHIHGLTAVDTYMARSRLVPGR
jgi:hypothetical protein